MTAKDITLWKSLARAVTGAPTDLGAYDADALVATARHHGVELLLYAGARAGQVQGLDQAVIGTLRTLTHAAVASDLMLNEATRNTLALLAEHGIPSLLLKGTPMAHLHYPSSYLRPRCDTDLLIRESQARQAAEILGKAGYVISGLGQRPQASRQFLAAWPMVSGHHIHFDMHWKLSNRVLFRDSLLFDNCQQSAQPVPALGEAAHALSNVDLLLHACIHRIGHGRNTERNRLIWLYDIHLLYRVMDEARRGEFRQAACDKKIGVLCADALRTAEELFGSELPGAYLQELEQNRSLEPSAGLIHGSKLAWAWADLRALPSLKAKAAFARELLLNRAQSHRH